MREDYCTKTSRKLRDLGYAPKPALRFARFFFIIMMSVCGLMGIYYVLSQVENISITGYGNYSGARAGLVSPDFSGLR